jgi:hypothetical protein
MVVDSTNTIAFISSEVNGGISQDSPLAWINRFTGVWMNHSDRRAKKDIREITVLEAQKVFTIEPQSYIINESRQTGFIAQDIKHVFPEIVCGSDDKYYHMNNSGLIPYIVKLIQSQANEIASLRSDVKILQQNMVDVFDRLNRVIFCSGLNDLNLFK